MGNLHICYIICSICIERRKCILPSWPQIYKPHDVINGCYVIFGYPSSHKIDWNAHKTAIKCPRKRPTNAHKNALKCTQRRRKNAHKNTYAQLMHHYNNVTLMCRYLKSCGFPSRWPVMWEAFRCDDSIIINLYFPVRIWSKMAQAEIMLSAAILDGLVTKIADVLMQVMVRCLAHMHQEGFLSLTDICQISTGINTWISITFLLK